MMVPASLIAQRARSAVPLPGPDRDHTTVADVGQQVQVIRRSENDPLFVDNSRWCLAPRLLNKRAGKMPLPVRQWMDAIGLLQSGRRRSNNLPGASMRGVESHDTARPTSRCSPSRHIRLSPAGWTKRLPLTDALPQVVLLFNLSLQLFALRFNAILAILPDLFLLRAEPILPIHS